MAKKQSRQERVLSLELVQRNEVVWGTLEQGTQRIKVQSEHFTEVVEGELEILTLSESSSKLTTPSS